MDWQTKEYIDEKFESIEDTLALITEHLGISEDNEEDLEEQIDNSEEETTKEINI